MSSLFETLRDLLDEEIDGIEVTPEGLRAVADARWGEVRVCVDRDEDEQEPETVALRVHVDVPPPAGAGQEFLLWCLATNTQYWSVKTGLDEQGMLCVHADIDATGPNAAALLAADVVDRVESILQLIDEDLADYCLAHGLGTPSQRTRWEARRPEGVGEE
jgi:hypothetical protein